MSFRNLLLIPLCAWIFAGCTPKIGNKCTLSTDCSQLGDRQCDATQRDGYCTQFNCDPDTCPDSICVAFDPNLDPACQGVDDGRTPRFQRTFCMAPCTVSNGTSCEAPGQCRDGYMCVDLSDPAWQQLIRARVVDTGAGDGGLGYGVCVTNPTYVEPDLSTSSVVQSCPDPKDYAPVTGVIPGVCGRGTATSGPDGGAPWPAYDGGTGGSGP
jgi:hypothetical protein